MKKLKNFPKSVIGFLEQKSKKYPKQTLISIATLVALSISMTIFLVACSENSGETPTEDNPSVTTETTTTEETTTPATTTASSTTEPPETSTEPEEPQTTPPETEPPVVNNDPVFQDMNKTMYSLGSPVNVRASWSTSSERVGTIAYAGEVKVTGYNADVGFYRVEFDGRTAYIVASYLSDTRPQAQQPNPNPNPNPQPNPQPQPTDPPRQPDPPQPPVGHTFTRADMEELLAYGQGLGFGFTMLTTPSDAIIVNFADDLDSFMLHLELGNNDNTRIRIGTRESGRTTLITFTGYNYSVSDAKATILNFYNR